MELRARALFGAFLVLTVAACSIDSRSRQEADPFDAGSTDAGLPEADAGPPDADLPDASPPDPGPDAGPAGRDAGAQPDAQEPEPPTFATPETVGPPEEKVAATSIGVDSLGAVHIAYTDSASKSVRHAIKANGSWTFGTLYSSSRRIDGAVAMAVDSTDGLHVCFQDPVGVDLRCAHKSPSQDWSSELVDEAGYVGGFPSMTRDGSDGLHVAYYDSSNPSLKYAYRAAQGTWQTTTVDPEGGWYTSIAVDASGGVHISHLAHSSLRYSYRPAGGSWSSVTLDNPSLYNVSLETSIAVDAAQGVHLCFHSGTHGALRYGYKPPGGAWDFRWLGAEAPESPAQVRTAQAPALAIDPSGNLHVAYFELWARDLATWDLGYSYRSPGGHWRRFTLDATDRAGESASLAVDQGGNLHVAYRAGSESSAERLKYVFGQAP